MEMFQHLGDLTEFTESIDPTGCTVHNALVLIDHRFGETIKQGVAVISSDEMRASIAVQRTCGVRYFLNQLSLYS